MSLTPQEQAVLATLLQKKMDADAAQTAGAEAMAGLIAGIDYRETRALPGAWTSEPINKEEN